VVSSTISPRQLYEKVAAGATVDVIDVRTPAEYAAVHATVARNVPLERLDAKQFCGSRNGSQEPLYVICRSGTRAEQAIRALAAAGASGLVCVEGGTLAWEREGLPVERGRNFLPLDRQMRIAAGSLVLIGALLGWLVHPGFYALSAFVGGGLVFAGITDICPLAMLIARMPWNQGGAKSAGGQEGGACCGG
jgi:rhodanese-related sulfurtransferase